MQIDIKAINISLWYMPVALKTLWICAYYRSYTIDTLSPMELIFSEVSAIDNISMFCSDVKHWNKKNFQNASYIFVILVRGSKYLFDASNAYLILQKNMRTSLALLTAIFPLIYCICIRMACILCQFLHSLSCHPFLYLIFMIS